MKMIFICINMPKQVKLARMKVSEREREGLSMSDAGFAARDGSGSRQLGLPRPAVRVLAACAESERICPELGLKDPDARQLFAELGGCATQFGVGELRCTAFRAFLIDELARDFFSRHSDGVGVSLWPMLGTRAQRLSASRWVEIDAPPLAALRQRYLLARPEWTELPACLCQAVDVAASHGARGPRLFVMDESVLPLGPEVMMRILDAIVTRAATGAELIMAFDAHAPLRSVGACTLELRVDSAGLESVRYPRLRFVDGQAYGEGLHASLVGLNTAARLQAQGALALAHLRVS